MRVFPVPDTFYGRCRRQYGAVALLREQEDAPPEILLQAIWHHQRLRRAELRTLDGQPVRILHPGFWNHGGGPDFRDAVVQIGDSAPHSGDVEIDLHSFGWHAHGHDQNPAFGNVILHVVWREEDAPDIDRSRSRLELPGAILNEPPPILALADALDAPLNELSFWLDSEAADFFPESLRGRCSAPVGRMAEDEISGLLRQAAQIRFRGKAAHFAARARQAGWEQSLWEGVFRALGYRRNVWPMQRLAEQRDGWLERERRPGPAPLELQARLLGISGLLPADMPRAPAGARTYLRAIWDCWWRERDRFADSLLPPSLWQLHGQRPANHPQRRLALAAHWLADEKWVEKIERWCAQEIDPRRLPGSLLEILQVRRDSFWSWHWTLGSPRLTTPRALLGPARATDLAVNVLLPWLWSRAAQGKRPALRRRIEERFEAWPPAQDNALLRLARQRVLGAGASRRLRSAAQQQGLLQIVRDFCDRSDALCDNCRFPELAKEFGAG